MRHPRLTAVACLVAAMTALAASDQDTAADLVLVNGTVLTVDADDTIAEALAVHDGRVLAVGSSDEIRRLIGPGTEVIDLAGRTATPGLIDAHLHVSPPSDQLDLGDPEIRSIADLQARLGEAVAGAPAGEWVRGRGWDEGKLDEARFLRASDLDPVSPNNPVWLTHTTGHYGVANTAALRAAGITRETPDPPAGTIERDEAGNPTGLMKEAATRLVTRNAGRGRGRGSGRGGADPTDGLAETFAAFNREGLTAVKDPGVNAGRFAQYRQLLEEGRLTVRVAALWRGGRTVESVDEAIARMAELPRAPDSLGDGRLVSAGVKLYIDGSGGARTGWLYDDWHIGSTGIDEGNVGYPTTEPEVYREQVRRLHQAGIHVGTHAVGDRAIDWVVDTYATVLEETPTPGLRHSIIHANIPTDHAIDAMARLQRDHDAAYPEAQAPFMWWIGDTYAGNFGPARAARLMPFRTYVERGVIWAGGSDYSVTPFAPRYGLWSSVTRRPFRGTYGDTAFGTAEAIDARAALRSYTRWAARQLFLEDRIGSLEVGKEADIAVWDRNPYRVDPDDLQHLRCELTVLAGEIVYRAPVQTTATRWYKGNTHTHTLNSDGDSTPDDVVRWYREHGYQFLVLTDHNYLTAVDALNALHGADERFIVIPGEEVTDGFEGASIHVNGLDVSRTVEPQGGASAVDTLQRNVDAIRAADGVPHINHPNFRWSLTPDELGQVQRNRLLEIFNGHPQVNNVGGGGVAGLEEAWDAILTSGTLLYGLAVDDAHTFKQPGNPDVAGPGRGWVMVRATRLEPDAILAALERGDFYASTGVVLDDYEVTAEAMTVRVRATSFSKYRIQFIGEGGTLLREVAAPDAVYTFGGDEAYVRARVLESNGRTAWGQPVMVAPRGTR